MKQEAKRGNKNERERDKTQQNKTKHGETQSAYISSFFNSQKYEKKK